MDYYVNYGIEILNDTTKSLKNLNELGIYLSKQIDIQALKSLKLMILASSTSLLEKSLDIHAIKVRREVLSHMNLEDNIGYDKKRRRTIIYDFIEKRESMIGNLAMNPQNFALALLEFLLHTRKIDFMMHPKIVQPLLETSENDSYTIFDLWVSSFTRIETEDDFFYQRYDMVDKKLEMLEYMIENHLIDLDSISWLTISLTACIKSKYSYTENQLMKTQKILQKLKEIEFTKIHEKQSNRNLEEIKICQEELSRYTLGNQQCQYMLKTIPTLIKRKIIK